VLKLDPAETALFLDFDGTLAPIVARPEMAAMAPVTRKALRAAQAACGGAVALVSGRSLADLERLSAPLGLPLAGSHGLERKDASGRVHGFEATENPMVAAALEAYAGRHDLLLERKPAGLALHFRNRPELEAEARALAAEIAEGHGLRIIQGHMVSELTQAGVNKGTAVAAFMAEPPFAGRRPVAVGDDTTDEDAIAAAQDLGGTGVRIGGTDSYAAVRFDTIDDFLAWFHTWALEEGSRA